MKYYFRIQCDRQSDIEKIGGEIFLLIAVKLASNLKNDLNLFDKK